MHRRKEEAFPAPETSSCDRTSTLGLCQCELSIECTADGVGHVSVHCDTCGEIESSRARDKVRTWPRAWERLLLWLHPCSSETKAQTARNVFALCRCFFRSAQIHKSKFPNYLRQIQYRDQVVMLIRSHLSRHSHGYGTGTKASCCRAFIIPTVDGSEILRSPVEVGSLSQYFSGF